MSKEIYITRGCIVLVDDEDFDRLDSVPWYNKPNGHGKPYAHSRTHGYMHRNVLSAPGGVQVDHINNDSLDNRKENLRIATGAENQHNRPKYATNKSGFKGVCWHKAEGKWRAQIGLGGKRICIGRFATAEEAHKAYCDAALRLHGDFARTV